MLKWKISYFGLKLKRNVYDSTGKCPPIVIVQFRYIKIQLEAKDVATRLRGMI